MITATQSEFAKLIGKDKSYVTRLKQQGRVMMTSDGKVDVEATQRMLDASADPSRTVVRHSEKHEPENNADKVSFNDARTRKELANAQHAEIDLAVKMGTLVDAEEARLFAADLAATFRASLEVLPDRLAPELVPLRETEALRAVLVENFEQLLTDVADKIKAWGTTE